MAIRFLTSQNIQAGTLTVSTIANLATASNTFLVSDGGLVKYRTAAQVRSDIGAGTGNGTVTSVAVTNGTGISASVANATTTPNITITNTDLGSSQAIFKNFAVSGQSTVVADTNNDTLTLVAGSNVTITTNATTDTITIASSYVDSNNYPTSLGWDTGTGILTLGRNGLSSLTVDLDGRYPENNGTGATGTWPISITGSSGSSNITLYVSSPDGTRNASDKLPNGNPPRAVQYDFASASSVGASGNYAGVMTYRPWDGTSASTGDSSYQLAFTNQSGVNASGPAQLRLRNGIDTTWNSWQTILSSSNYNSYSPTLTGGGASGNWGINITGNASSVNTTFVSTNADYYLTFVDSNNGSPTSEFLYTIGTIKVNPNTGALTSNSFVKSGGTASQYLMANGSVSTLTNPVTGTGTTNYISKWTSGSAIGNSLIYDNGTYVGINTTTSSSKLEIDASSWGITGATVSRMLQKSIGYVGDYSQHVILLHAIYDTTLIAYNKCSGTIYATRGGTGSGLINDTYIIDTASAYNSYNGTIISSNGYGRLFTCFYNSVRYIALIPAYRTSAVEYNFDGYIASTNAELQIVTYRMSNSGTIVNSEVYNSLVEYVPTNTIYQGGGLQVVGQLFDSSGDGGSSGQMLSSTGTGTNWVNAPTGTISGSGTTNYIPKFTGATSLGNSQIFDDGIYVGIGTASPTSLLHVSGSTLINGPLTVQGSPTDLQYTLINNDLDIIQGQAEANNYGTYSRLRLFRASGTIASPTTPSSGTAVGRLEFGAYNSGSATFIANAKIEASMDATTGANDLPSRLAFFTTPDSSTTMIERMRINNAGLIRIGGTTMNFSDVLNVEAGSIAFENGYGLRFTNTSGTPYASVYSSNNNTVIKSLGTAVLIKDNSGANDIITALDGGNVGIGTSSPSYKLDVNGIAILRSALYMTAGGGSSVPNWSFQINGSGDLVVDDAITTQNFIFGNAGQVLIGTTVGGTPAYGSVPQFVTASATGGVIDIRSLNTNIVADSLLGRIQFTGKDDLTAGYTSAAIEVVSAGSPSSGSNGGGTLKFMTSANGYGTNPAPRMWISYLGYVTIGSTNTNSYPLRVTTQVGSISIYADYDIVAYSDQSVKENIRPIENVIERVQKSRGVLYDRTDSGSKDNIGFIAQELEVAFPELVVTNEDGTKAVKYQNAVAVMFEAIKEQQKQIDELKELVTKLIK